MFTTSAQRPPGGTARRAARRFLATSEARVWDAWEALLSPDVVYELPQSRQRIRGRAAYRLVNETQTPHSCTSSQRTKMSHRPP